MQTETICTMTNVCHNTNGLKLKNLKDYIQEEETFWNNTCLGKAQFCSQFGLVWFTCRKKRTLWCNWINKKIIHEIQDIFLKMLLNLSKFAKGAWCINDAVIFDKQQTKAILGVGWHNRYTNILPGSAQPTPLTALSLTTALPLTYQRLVSNITMMMVVMLWCYVWNFQVDNSTAIAIPKAGL